MKNIIKAQLYQLFRDRFFRLLLIMLIPFQGVFTFITISQEDKMSGCDFFVQYMSIMFLIPMMLVAYVTGAVCAGDFSDKTANYEVLSGRNRRDVFFARVIISLIFSIIGFLVIAALPLVIVTAMNGWGTQMDPADAVLRTVMLIFPMFRVICFMIFVAFITRNQYIAMAFGFVSAQAVSLGLINKPSLVMGLSTMKQLVTVSSHYVYGLDTDAVYTYEASLSPSIIVGTVAVSVIAGVISLILGNYFFKKDDLE